MGDTRGGAKLFDAIKHVKTETGLTWDIATSVRRVLTKEGKVTIATGQGETYKELETPTKVHGLVGTKNAGLLSRMCKFLFQKAAATARRRSGRQKTS